MAEREVLLNAVFVRGMDEFGAAQTATAFSTLALAEVTAASARAQDFARRRDFEALGY